MKRYVFLYEDYPLGQIEFDEEKGIGKFTYCFTSSTPEFIKVKPETAIMLLEDIRYDAMDIKTIGEFERYVSARYGNFHYEAIKGYE